MRLYTENPSFSGFFPEPAFKIRVAEARQFPELSIPVHPVNVRQRHAVERVVFAGGIDGHVSEHQAAARFRFAVQAVFTDHIACQAGSWLDFVFFCWNCFFSKGVTQYLCE